MVIYSNKASLVIQLYKLNQLFIANIVHCVYLNENIEEKEIRFLLSAGVIILKEYLDSTVKTENDIYELIRISVVGIIPQYIEK